VASRSSEVNFTKNYTLLYLYLLLAYTYITVKFQRRSYLNVRLTEGSLYIRFRIERSPKWGLEVILNVGAKIFGGKVHSSSELRVFRHLWSRYDAPCSSIMYG